MTATATAPSRAPGKVRKTVVDVFMPTKLNLDDIDPRLGPQFSPNLYAYLKAPRNALRLTYGRVFRDAEGALWLGFIQDGLFTGRRLQHILSEGARAETFCYPDVTAGLKEVKDFWRRYRKIGRCAVDVAHERYFADDDKRWTYTHGGRRRHCAWCGQHTQARHTRTRKRIVKTTTVSWDTVAA